MNKIIVPLNDDVLLKFGFTFDGYYWIHPNAPFKLVLSNQENTYMVEIPGADIGSTPPPIKSNHQLLMMMTQLAGPYLQQSIEPIAQVMEPQQLIEEVQNIVERYFNFQDDKLKMVAMINPTGIELKPGNEITLTIISGVQMRFLVYFKDDTDEEIFYNPGCISYPFIKSLFPDKEPKSVDVMTSNGWQAFFGVGIRS